MSRILSRSSPQNSAPKQVTAGNGPTQVTAGPGHISILVIDDDPGVRQLARRTLEAVGYQVLEAEDGEVGLRMVEEHAGRLDLVLTDIEMPRLDGISVARAIRAKYPSISVVCMSGRLPETTFQARVGLPLPPFLVKPFTLDDLTRTASETMARGGALAWRSEPPGGRRGPFVPTG